ncbi:MAG: hypothetical protein ACQETH_15285 [Candidatus Rifleibacteriota bacterium]
MRLVEDSRYFQKAKDDELLWTKNLATILKVQKETIIVYKKNEINYYTNVELIFVESKGFKIQSSPQQENEKKEVFEKFCGMFNKIKETNV